MSKEVIEEKPIEEQTPEELQKTIEAEKATPPAPKFEHTASDGTVYKADAIDEFLDKIKGALDNTKTHARRVEAENREMREKLKTAPVVEPPKDAPKFDQNAYLKLLENDALAAQKYLHSFDDDFQQVRQVTQKTADAEKIRLEVASFYQDVPTYAKIENKELNDLMRERMTEKGRTFTADSMKLTYYELRDEGKIKEPAGAPVRERPRAPQSPEGANNVETAGEPDFDSMTAKELAAYMKTKKVPGAEYLH